MAQPMINAAPMTYLYGTEDDSIRTPVQEPESLPTHLPKVYGYTERGPVDPQLVSGSSRSIMYGEKSFDLRQPYATHQTVLSNIVNAQGNAQMFERVQPADAGPPASLRIYLDVLKTRVPLYERNEDGSYVLDEDGEKVPTGQTTPGHKVKWYTEMVKPTPTGDDSFGQGQIMPGDMVDPDTQEQSKRYPIQDLRVSHFGKYGNNIAFRMWAPTLKSATPVDERLIATQKVYPYRMAALERTDEYTSPKLVTNNFGEKSSVVVFKPETIDRNTDSKLYAGDVYLDAYQKLSTLDGLPKKFGPFGRHAIYQANIDLLLKQFLADEVAFIDQFSDFTGEDDEHYRFNFVSGVSSQNVPYHSFIMNNSDANSAIFTESSSRFATGGNDGTMNEEEFDKSVRELVKVYADPDGPYTDTAVYVESIMYDTGFSLETKYALCSFISVRKDTFIVLAVHDVLGKTLSVSEETSLAIALRTRLQMYPESEYYGTPVMRGMVVGRSGILIDSQYSKRLPLTLEVAHKAAKYMGASNGIWRNVNNFDMAPGSIVELMSDINITYTPASVRNRDWDAGLVWVQSFDRRQFFFPAMKTVYDNDTSVLNSFFTAMGIVELEKVGERAWRQFTGTSKLTNAQITERTNQFVDQNTVGRFDDRFVIVPNAFVSVADKARGFSWSLVIDIYAANMKTAMSLSIRSRRIEDLEQQ